MTESASIILFYCLATLIAIVTRHLRVPYTAALLVVGVALGAVHVVALPHLTKDLLFTVFLPGLIFEAAYGLRVSELRTSAATIGVLAVPGVVLTIAITAGLLVAASQAVPALGHIGWQAALVFGTVVAATDPVAVTSLLREVNAPRRLRVLLEGESLLNDGTSIVAFTLLIAYIAGSTTSPLTLVADFLRMTLGGALLGVAIGWGVSHVRHRVGDVAIEITLTTIAAYGSFVLAEWLGCSGVIATVAAGVTCGHAARQFKMTDSMHAAVDGYWEWMAFALNSAVFVLLGAEVSLSALWAAWPLIAGGAVAVLVARAIVVVASAFSTQRHEHIPRAWQGVMTWGGLKGALSLVLALALPADLADRDTIISMTAGTVVISLLVQAVSMPLMLRRLKVAAE